MIVVSRVSSPSENSLGEYCRSAVVACASVIVPPVFVYARVTVPCLPWGSGPRDFPDANQIDGEANKILRRAPISK